MNYKTLFLTACPVCRGRGRGRSGRCMHPIDHIIRTRTKRAHNTLIHAHRKGVTNLSKCQKKIMVDWCWTCCGSFFYAIFAVVAVAFNAWLLLLLLLLSLSSLYLLNFKLLLSFFCYRCRRCCF